MKTLNIYIFRRIVISCCLSVGMYTLVLLVGRALKEILGLLAAGYVTLFEFLGMVATLVPFVVSYALPLGMLTGVLLVLGKLSSQNEITAMRCAGISLWRISAPIFAIAVLGVTGSLMINNYYAPIANTTFKAKKLESVSADPLKVIVAKSFIRDFSGRILYIGEKDDTEMRDFWIWQLDERRNVFQLVRAKRGEFHYDEEEGALILTVYDGYAENRDSSDPDGLDKPLMAGSFKKGRIKLPLDKFFGRATYNRKLSGLNFNELLRERESTLASEELNSEEKFGQLIRVQSQIQKNFALAYSVLSFTFLAIPLGIKVGRSENYANLLVALGLAFVWYLSFVIIGWLETNPTARPDLLIWLPNLGYQILGIYLFTRISKK